MLGRLIILSSFWDIFPYTEVIDRSERFIPSNGMFWLHECYFRSLYSDSTAAISLIEVQAQFAVEDTTFSECVVTQRATTDQAFTATELPDCNNYYYYGCGGAICYFCPSVGITFGGIGLNRVCGYNCSSRQNSLTTTQIDNACGYYSHRINRFIAQGHFVYLFAHLHQRVEANYTSVSSCSMFDNWGEASMVFKGGKSGMIGSNISANKAHYYSGVHFNNVNGIKVKFSTYANNIATHSTMMIFSSVVNSMPLQFSNIINNTQAQTTNGIIYNNNAGAISFDKCIFGLNSRQYLFQTLTGYLNIISSFLDDQSSIGSPGVVFNDDHPLTKTYAISHYGTMFCVMEPFVPTDPEIPGGVPPTPPQSMYPSPTECIFDPSLPDNSVKLATIFHIIANTIIGYVMVY